MTKPINVVDYLDQKRAAHLAATLCHSGFTKDTITTTNTRLANRAAMHCHNCGQPPAGARCWLVSGEIVPGPDPKLTPSQRTGYGTANSDAEQIRLSNGAISTRSSRGGKS